MLRLAGPTAGIQERQLAAQQADALGAGLERGLDLRHGAGIGQQTHSPAVNRDRWIEPLGAAAPRLLAGG